VNTAGDGGRFPTLAALAVGLLLIGLALPWTIAGILALPGDGALAALGRGERLSGPRLAVAIDGHRRALGWRDDAEIRTGLGALYLARGADRSLSGPVRDAFLDAAIRQFRAGLARGPARPYGWTQYAAAELMRDGARARLDAPLGLSLVTGRYEPRLIMQRVALGFFAERRLRDDTRAALRGQVRLATTAMPRALAEFARRRYALGWVRSALAADRTALHRFEAAYFSLPMR
jgi:hypothetical protein